MKRRVNLEEEKAKGEGEHLKCTHNAQFSFTGKVFSFR